MRLRNIAFYAIFILLQVAFVELALQSYYRLSTGDWLIRRVDLPLFVADDVRVYRVKSNLEYHHTSNEFSVTYYTDNLGLRSPTPDKVTRARKEPGTYRVLFLGPSFSFGTAGDYADTYVARIESRLQEADPGVEVVNLGTPAQPVRWQLCWVKEKAKEFGIDLVIQTVYGKPVLGDRRCDKTPPLPVIEDGYLYRTEPSLRKRVIADAKKSAIVFYSWYLYQLYFAPEGTEEGVGTEFYTEVDQSGLDSGEVVASYREFVQYVKSNVGPETEVAFLHIPFSYMVNPEDAKRFSHQGVSSPRELVARTKEVERILRENGIPFIVPMHRLIENAEKERQYNFIDVHFTAAGNETVADYAAPRIAALIAKSRRSEAVEHATGAVP